MPPNRVVVFFLVAALLFSTVTVGVVAGQNDVTLTVTVVDQDGTAVSDVDLSATWEDGGGPVEETTRSNGQALIDVPDGTNVTITVHDEDYVRNDPFTLDDAATGDVEIQVSQSGTATIDVVDVSGPVRNAIVQLSHDGYTAVNTRTDGDGHLATDAIEQGVYELRVWKEGYLRNTTNVAVDGSVSKTISLRQDSRLLSVRVTDDHVSPPQPVQKATVEVDGSSVTTLSNGETTIQVPVNDRYDVSVTKDGYMTNSTTIHVAQRRQTANLTINRTPAISLEPANDQVVVGQTDRVVVVDEYGDPVPDADVAINGNAVGQTNDQGAIAVVVDSAGTHTISATSDGLEANVSVDGIRPGGRDSPTKTETDAPTSIEQPTTTDESGPGFTVIGSLAAFLAAGVLFRRR